jgi:hypothetical protein
MIFVGFVSLCVLGVGGGEECFSTTALSSFLLPSPSLRPWHLICVFSSMHEFLSAL